MEIKEMLKILNRIKIFLNEDSLDLAKDLLRLEIENLKGITEEICKNSKYSFYNNYCKYCSNYNCSGYKSKLKVNEMIDKQKYK